VQPPASPPKVSRRHPRYEMYASVELEQHGETVILPAQNISLGGVFLAADGHDLSGLEIGGELDVQVFDALDEHKPPVRLHAEVMRLDHDGVALQWTSTDSDCALKLAKLLNTMQPKKAKPAKK
jgi:hypothetical protein